ncbi:MAG: phosphoglycerate dehydrogenase [Myxococcales bacterium]|nr:phosphoglycerate dehydrogenase [Myxococcales bacterium]
MNALSFPKEKIQILLLEGIHDRAVEHLGAQGYENVVRHETSLTGADLTQALASAHMIGIRSRTQLTREVIEAAPRLMAIGCFCIGTNQVDLKAAASKGIPVFNAPHSNTRSVAELVLAEMVMLVRGIFDKSSAAHRGEWHKTASRSHELRGKTIGIVGYGHIGSQVSILGESFGLRVLFYDIEPKLAMGNARQVGSLEEMLPQCDFVTLHVPEAPDTKNMFDRRRFELMRPGSCFLNLSRGNVVVIDDLVDALRSKHLLGAAIDVFPAEPKSNDDRFESPLQNLPNVILTPHIGGSTHEAQVNIGLEVATKLVLYSDVGATIGAVNFPNISLPVKENAHRLLNIHRNQPGVLSAINRIISEADGNVLGQYLQTTPELGYVVVDVDRDGSNLKDKIDQVDGVLRTRILY